MGYFHEKLLTRHNSRNPGQNGCQQAKLTRSRPRKMGMKHSRTPGPQQSDETWHLPRAQPAFWHRWNLPEAYPESLRVFQQGRQASGGVIDERGLPALTVQIRQQSQQHLFRAPEIGTIGVKADRTKHSLLETRHRA